MEDLKKKKAIELLREWSQENTEENQFFLLHTYKDDKGVVRAAGDYAVEYDVLKHLFKAMITARTAVAAIMWEALKETINLEELDNEEDDKIQEQGGMACE